MKEGASKFLSHCLRAGVLNARVCTHRHIYHIPMCVYVSIHTEPTDSFLCSRFSLCEREARAQQIMQLGTKRNNITSKITEQINDDRATKVSHSSPHHHHHLRVCYVTNNRANIDRNIIEPGHTVLN